MTRRALLFGLVVAPLAAQQSTPVVRFGGYLDTYYAWDDSKPANHERAFTTQAIRHGEFNVNLVFLEASVNADRVRGRLAVWPQW